MNKVCKAKGEQDIKTLTENLNVWNVLRLSFEYCQHPCYLLLLFLENEMEKRDTLYLKIPFDTFFNRKDKHISPLSAISKIKSDFKKL